MDQALIRERELFKKRALAQPTVEKRKSKSSEQERPVKKPRPAPRPKDANSGAGFDYKTAHGSSQYKFGILAKVVNFMKARHLREDTYPLSLDEILDETHQTDVGNKNKHWLMTEALPNNQKLTPVDEDGEKKYKYNPKLLIKDRRALLNLLKHHDLHGEGGILLDDIEESLPNSAKSILKLGDSVTTITRPNDKKKILYYNDKYCQFNVDEEFVKLWRGVSVDGQDERKIEEYLEKQGITSMQDIGLKKVLPSHKRKKGANRRFKKHNDHLAGVLKDYGEFKANKT